MQRRRESKKTASEWRGPCKIQLLPPDIIIDILSRLPIKTILCCKCVCKDWLCLISHPCFVELQLARSSPAILIENRSCLTDEICRTISLTHVEQCDRASFRLDKWVLTPECNLPSSRFRLVNSCNGLLCLSREETDPLWVCNPILGEYVTIPPTRKKSYWGSFIALGFCSVTNRYKLLKIFYPKDFLACEYLHAKIYDMDRGTWRSIGHAPCAYVRLPFNSFFRDSLHWVREYGNAAKYIYSFNFETEEFGSVPPPPCLDPDDTRRQFFGYVILNMGVVEGCLFLCVFGSNGIPQFDIWIMKDYGVKESWTKQFVIDDLYRPALYTRAFYEPIKFLNNEEILMLYDSQIVCYNTETKTFRGSRITLSSNQFHKIIAHTPSLVSLHHVVREELVQRVQGRKRKSAKLPAEGTVDCAGFETSPPNDLARFDSTPDQGHPGVTFHL